MATLIKTVAILGASYGGSGAVRRLIEIIPKDWRIVLIDRNSHMNHLYVLPRFAVIPGHEYKAFISYDRLLEDPSSNVAKRHLFLHAQVTSMSQNELTLSRSFPDLGMDERLRFDYLIYALGSHLPAPINMWGPVDQSFSLGLAPTAEAPTDLKPRDALESSTAVPQDVQPPNAHAVADQSKLAPIAVGTKPGGIEWLKRFQKQVKGASSVLVVGGGALGIQYALDIAEVYPNKRVTLLHSREKLLPRFDEAMHTEIISSLWSANVNVILGERLDLSSVKAGKFTNRADGTPERVVTTEGGREIQAELIMLCTGQTPNTALLSAILPESIVPSGPSKGMLWVQRTLQVAVPYNAAGCEGEGEPELTVPYPHIFAIGDAADAYGAINAGHNAYAQGRLAAENIVKLIEGRPRELERYEPGPPAIKISLGLTRSLYQIRGVVGTKGDAREDLDAGSMWQFYGYESDEETMHR